MKTLSFRLLLVFCALATVFVACKKETSLENGLSAGDATGELVDSLGFCKRIDVQGSYQVDTPLNTTTNYATVNINFTSQGKYKVYSDTVNGMWFIDSGFTVTTGPTTIRIKGYGTPILPKVTDFTLFYLNTVCTFSVNAGGTAGGSSTGTKNDYFPTTSGSAFNYKYIPSVGNAPNNVDGFSVGVAAGLVRYDNLDYARFGTSLLDTFYFAKDGAGTYYALSTIDFDYTFAFDTVPNFFISYPFLKENANVGENWSTAEYGPIWTGGKRGMAKAIFEIAAKNITYSVGGNNYSQVINVKRTIMFKEDGGSYVNFLVGNSYYAKNYGLIDQVLQTSNNQKISIDGLPSIK